MPPAEPRLKSGLWVAAYLRRCQAAGLGVYVARKGDDDAGAVLVVIVRARGEARVFGREPDAQGRSVFKPLTDWTDEAAAGAVIARRVSRDGDLWVIEVESRDGAAFLDEM